MERINVGDRMANRWLGRLTRDITSWLEFTVLSYYKRFDRQALDFLREVWREQAGSVLFSPHELFMLLSIARAQRNRRGDYAEVGVFKGTSARVLAELKLPETRLLLFDTFEGLPYVGNLDSRFKRGMFESDEASLKERLAQYSNVHIIKGLFPDSATSIGDARRFSFVHLDVDTYASTLASLEFFADRMLPGAVILSHDYSQCQGVYEAVQHFLRARPGYRLIELSVSQAMLIRDL